MGEARVDVARVGCGEGCVAVITIRRPGALNALTFDMIRALSKAFREIREDPPEISESVRAVVLTGCGRAFSSGIDLSAAAEVFGGSESDLTNDVVHQMEALDCPIIGAINGAAVTAGFEIALACDVLVASPEAFFMDTHCKFGIMPGWGLSQKLPRLIGVNRAREVAFTSRKVSATEAERWGLVNRVVSGEKLVNTAIEIGQRIAKNQQTTVKNYKKVLSDGYALALGEAREMERRVAWQYYREMDPKHFERLRRFIQSRSASRKPASKL